MGFELPKDCSSGRQYKLLQSRDGAGRIATNADSAAGLQNANKTEHALERRGLGLDIRNAALVGGVDTQEGFCIKRNPKSMLSETSSRILRRSTFLYSN